MVVLPEDHPFAPGGRFASLLIRDRDLADGLAIGFHGLWKKAMKTFATSSSSTAAVEVRALERTISGPESRPETKGLERPDRCVSKNVGRSPGQVVPRWYPGIAVWLMSR